MANKNIIEKLKKAVEVLSSSHVQSVQCAFEYSAGDVRYYTVITHKGFEQHRYKVRVQDWFNDQTNETENIYKCSCPAGKHDMVCRHILKVAETEADEFNRPLQLDAMIGYQAYKHYQKGH